MRDAIEDILHHLLHYAILGLILLGGLAIIVHFSFTTQFRFLGVTVIAYFYVLWGIFHHLFTHKHLPLSIVVEYVLVALVGVVLARGMFGIK